MSLKISSERALPLKFLSLRKVVFGGSGSGKTSWSRVLFEEATAAGVLCGAVDLKGDFWGLKSTADGQGNGIPVVIFGGEHQDVPLDEAGGTSLADIVVELRQPFVVDLEQLSKGKQLRFLGAFFERLYDRNREPLVLLCDEADRYAPQKPMSPEANVCLGAAEDIAKRGRKHGIFPMFITQRNASLNKGVSELCDVAIVFRTPGPRDQEAVEDWFGTKATREQRDEVMAKLAGLPTGTAVLCSAHPDLKLFATVAIREPATFDSSATPEIGKRRIEPKHLATPDLEKLKTKMAATIEKAKAEDPRALRARIAQLEAERKEWHKNAIVSRPAPAPKRVEVPVLTDVQIKRMEVLAGRIEAILKQFNGWQEAFIGRTQELRLGLAEIAATVRAKLRPAPPTSAAPISPRMEAVRQQQRASSTGRVTSIMVSRRTEPADEITPAKQRILDALAFLEGLGLAQADKTQLALMADARPTSGAYFNNLGALRTAELLVYPRPGAVALTDAGRTVADASHAPTTTAELHAVIRAKLPPAKWRLLEALIGVYPTPLAKDELAARAGARETSGAYFNNLGSLRSLGLIDYPAPGQVVAQPVLFLDGR